MEQVPRNTNRVNLEHAFTTAEQHLGIPRLLDPEGTFILQEIYFEIQYKNWWYLDNSEGVFKAE